VQQETVDKRKIDQVSTGTDADVNAKSDDVSKKSKSDSTTVPNEERFLLVYVYEYHGGSRGTQLGIYSSVDKARNAWKEYLEDDEEMKQKVEKLNGDYQVFGPKIIKYQVDKTPTQFWEGEDQPVNNP
jgi:hypothetical protein